MNTKERIKKLAIGGAAVSTKDLDDAKAQYQAILSQMSSDDAESVSRQNQAAAYLQSVANMSSANPSTNKRDRHRSAEAYRNATKMLTGEFKTAEAVNPYTGGYSRRGGYADADRVAVDFMIKNQGKKLVQPAAAVDGGDFKDNYTFNWSKYLGAPRGLNDSLGDRVLSYAKGLKRSIDEAIEKKSTHYIDGDFNEADSATLAEIINGLESKAVSDVDAYNLLGSLSQSYDRDGNHWNAYFKGLLPEDTKTDADRRHDELLAQKYKDFELGDEYSYLGDYAKNYRFMKDENDDIYAFDKNWNRVNGLQYINLEKTDDPATNRYGYGIFSVGDDGRIFLGNTFDINDSHWANEEWNGENGLLGQIKTKNGKGFLTHTFSRANDYSDSTLVNTFIEQHPQFANANFADVSASFKGDQKIIAFKPDGTEINVGDFGELQNPKELMYMWQLPTGEVKTGSFDEAKDAMGGFNRFGFGEATDQTGAVYGLNNIFDDVEGISRDTNFRPYSGKRILGAAAASAAAGAAAGLPWGGGVFSWATAGIGAGIGALIGGGSELIAQWWNNSSIGEHPQDFFVAAIKALEHPTEQINLPGADMKLVNGLTGSEFINHLGGRQKVIATLAQFVREGELGEAGVPDNYIKQFESLRRQYYKAHKDELSGKVNVHEEGGILKAASGAEFYAAQNTPQHVNDWHDRFGTSKEVQKEESDIEKAKADGYDDVNLWRANKNTKLTAADMVRIGSIAADVTSIAASFASGTGVGAAVAEATGVASFAGNTFADFIDPSVTAGEAIKNTAIGAGLAAISFIPGSKIPSTLAKVAKIAPKVMMAAGAMGLVFDEGVHNTFKKVAEGKEKLNTQDWKNIAHVMMLVSAGTRGGRRAYEKHIAKSEYIKPSEKIGVFEGSEKIGEMSKTQQKTFNEAIELAKKGEADKAAEKLASANITLKVDGNDTVITKDAAANFISKYEGKWDQLKHIGKKGSLNLSIKQLEGEFNYDKAASDFKKAANTTSVSERVRNHLTWKQMGIVDALGDTPEGVLVGNRNASAIQAQLDEKAAKYRETLEKAKRGEATPKEVEKARLEVERASSEVAQEEQISENQIPSQDLVTESTQPEVVPASLETTTDEIETPESGPVFKHLRDRVHPRLSQKGKENFVNRKVGMSEEALAEVKQVEDLITSELNEVGKQGRVAIRTYLNTLKDRLNSLQNPETAGEHSISGSRGAEFVVRRRLEEAIKIVEEELSKPIKVGTNMDKRVQARKLSKSYQERVAKLKELETAYDAAFKRQGGKLL